MYLRVKFKVGQVWAQAGTGTRYIIEAIHKDGLVSARRGITKEVRNFIHVDKNHLAEIDISNWNQIVPRECPCGIDRRSCTYHQLESYQRLGQ
jgi:hypothetical protein